MADLLKQQFSHITTETMWNGKSSPAENPMLDQFPIILNDDHLARVAPVEGPLHDPDLQMLEDADLDMLAATLTQGRMRPIQIFAYGSLIWNQGFPVQSRRHATAIAAFRSRSIISAAHPSSRG